VNSKIGIQHPQKSKSALGQPESPQALDNRAASELEAWATLLFRCLCMVLLVCPAANAQSYSIDWFTIDGGGGTSTGGVYQVTAPLASRTPDRR